MWTSFKPGALPGSLLPRSHCTQGQGPHPAKVSPGRTARPGQENQAGSLGAQGQSAASGRQHPEPSHAGQELGPEPQSRPQELAGKCHRVRHHQVSAAASGNLPTAMVGRPGTARSSPSNTVLPGLGATWPCPGARAPPAPWEAGVQLCSLLPPASVHPRAWTPGFHCACGGKCVSVCGGWNLRLIKRVSTAWYQTGPLALENRTRKPWDLENH